MTVMNKTNQAWYQIDPPIPAIDQLKCPDSIKCCTQTQPNQYSNTVCITEHSESIFNKVVLVLVLDV